MRSGIREGHLKRKKERKQGGGRRNKMRKAYSEYPLARLMFWSAAIATVSLFMPSIKIRVMKSSDGS